MSSRRSRRGGYQWENVEPVKQVTTKGSAAMAAANYGFVAAITRTLVRMSEFRRHAQIRVLAKRVAKQSGFREEALPLHRGRSFLPLPIRNGPGVAATLR